MTRREGIIRSLTGERNERIPRALYGGGRWAYRQTGLAVPDLLSDPEMFGNSIADLFSRLDTDIIFAGSGFNTFPAEAIGGSLSMNDGQSPLLSFPLIQRTDDARFLTEIDVSHSPHTLALINMTGVLRERLADRFLCTTTWGPFTWAMILCDWNLLKEKTVMDIEFVREVCELGVRLSKAFCGPLAEKGLIDGIAVPDGAVTLIPDDLYREIILPCERSLFEWARGIGLKSIFHQCGAIGSQFPLYTEALADCISVDACVPIGDAYRTYRGKAATAGNVDAVNIIMAGKPDTISAAAAECISSVPAPHTGFILMSSCDPPPDTPMQNITAFLEAADST